MRKILLSAVAMIIAVGALSAQEPKQFIGGSIFFDRTKSGEIKTTSIGVNPQFGVMFGEKWGVAVDFSYAETNLNFSSYLNEMLGDKKNTSFGFGLTGLHMVKIADKFFFAPTLRAGYENGETALVVFNGEVIDTYDNDEKFKYTGFSIALNLLRFEFCPNDRWGFNLSFGGAGFVSTKRKGADKASGNSVTVRNSSESQG